MNARAGHWMQTYTGRAYWPMDPRADEVDIIDIAHSLAMQCRYTGHVDRFYSVAEHSVLVSRLVPPRLALMGLLHDAAEAYLTDIARPVKQHLANYRDIEFMNWKAIAMEFALPVEMPPEIHQADRRVLAAEMRALMKPRPFAEQWPECDVEPADVAILCWSPTLAEFHFLRRFAEIRPRGDY